jgi:hypothetical protein
MFTNGQRVISATYGGGTVVRPAGDLTVVRFDTSSQQDTTVFTDSLVAS